jgi:MFS transporter, DHA1 family, tetracycline resistance protein
MSAASAYVVDVTTHDNRARAFGLISAAFGLGFIVSPVIGGLAGKVDPRLPFWIAACLSLVSVIYGLLVLPESLSPEHRTARLDRKRVNPLGSLPLLRRHRELSGLSIVNFVTLVAHEALPVLWVLYVIAQFGWDERAIGLSLALVGLVSAFTAATLVAPAIKLFGERRIMLIGMMTFTVKSAYRTQQRRRFARRHRRDVPVDL